MLESLYIRRFSKYTGTIRLLIYIVTESIQSVNGCQLNLITKIPPCPLSTVISDASFNIKFRRYIFCTLFYLHVICRRQIVIKQLCSAKRYLWLTPYVCLLHTTPYANNYRQTSNKNRTKSQNLNLSRLVLQLLLPKPLWSNVKSRMKM